jgi:ATP-binding cassette subfamily B multidrug efflux pump
LKNFSESKWWSILWVKSQVVLLLFIFLSFVVSSIIGFWTPRVIVEFYNSLEDNRIFKEKSFILIGLLAIEYINRFIFQITTYRYVQILINQVRIKSYSFWLNSPFKKKESKSLDDFPMGEVLARIMNDTDAVREVVTSGSFGIFIDIIFVLSSLISFLTFNSQTGLIVFIAEIFAIWGLLKGSKLMGNLFGEVRKVTGKLARELTDITSGLKELSLTPNQNYALRRGERISEEFLSKQLKANVWDAGYYSAAESLYPILIALVMIFLPFSKIAEVSILAALIDLIQRSINPIKEVASKVSVLARAKSGIDRVVQFHKNFEASQVLIVDDFKRLNVNDFNFELEHFSYDQIFTLENLRLNLKKGELLGIVGESGSGKSTLLKLLCGQGNIFKGKIKVDDLEIDPEKESELRKFCQFVSLVSQESHVFTNSVKFNITLGDEREFGTFWELANKAIPYLKRYELSPESEINAKGISLGQKQLISGLRALYLKKPIILMDELSSGMDSDLEAALGDLIKFMKSNSITIIVTHRLETILKADHIIMLEAGKIVAEGNQAKLKESSEFKYFLKHLGS